MAKERVTTTYVCELCNSLYKEMSEAEHCEKTHQNEVTDFGDISHAKIANRKCFQIDHDAVDRLAYLMENYEVTLCNTYRGNTYRLAVYKTSGHDVVAFDGDTLDTVIKNAYAYMDTGRYNTNYRYRNEA